MTDETVRVRKGRSALLLVDIQVDFLPGGALPVRDGDAIIKPVRELLGRGLFGLYVATQDWHPPGHVSFASRHAGRAPLEIVQLHGHEQVLWPDHCVQGTAGAELHPGLDWSSVSAIIRKGTDPASDSYSGLRNNWNADGERLKTGLAGYLRERGIEDVYLCGLARDYCVKWSAEDASAAGFNAYFLWDLTRPVAPEEDARTRADLEAAGVRVITAGQLSG
jgi:nicotinamidase/pyrazinamidase